MAVYRLTGADSITINNRIITDLPSGDVVKVTFPNELVTVKTGKNGNAIYASNASGKQCSVELRVLRGTPDDSFLNTLLLSYQASPPDFVLMNGQLSKRIGSGADGVVTTDTYVLTAGVFTKLVETTSNVEGDIEQAVSLYTMSFAIAPRAIT